MAKAGTTNVQWVVWLDNRDDFFQKFMHVCSSEWCRCNEVVGLGEGTEGLLPRTGGHHEPTSQYQDLKQQSVDSGDGFYCKQTSTLSTSVVFAAHVGDAHTCQCDASDVQSIDGVLS